MRRDKRRKGEEDEHVNINVIETAFPESVDRAEDKRKVLEENSQDVEREWTQGKHYQGFRSSAIHERHRKSSWLGTSRQLGPR
jgi:hypothetical protein